MIKITRARSFIDVDIDGRQVRIPGEMIVGGFVAYINGIDKWTVPQNQPITESEKKDIIDKVIRKTANSHMIITFEQEDI